MPTKYQKFQPDRFKYCTKAPDRPFGFDVSYACFLHDKAYSKRLNHPVKEANHSRLRADFEFFKDILKQSFKQIKILRGILVAFVYGLGVRIFGKKYWKKW